MRCSSPISRHSVGAIPMQAPPVLKYEAVHGVRLYAGGLLCCTFLYMNHRAPDLVSSEKARKIPITTLVESASLRLPWLGLSWLGFHSCIKALGITVYLVCVNLIM